MIEKKQREREKEKRGGGKEQETRSVCENQLMRQNIEKNKKWVRKSKDNTIVLKNHKYIIIYYYYSARNTSSL